MPTVPSNSTSTALSADSATSDPVGLGIVWLATLFLLVAVLTGTPLQSANDRSRWCTVWSLVERGTYQIDEIDQHEQWSTIDKVRHRTGESEPYHFYSSKPPLLATIVAGFYWIERHTLGYSLLDHTEWVSRMLLVIINVLPMFLALLSLRKSLRLLGVVQWPLWVLLAVAGFGSMLNPFLTTLNNHTPAAIFLIFCLSAMIRLQTCKHPNPRDFAVIGFTAALTCCFELPAALFGLLSFGFAVRHDWKKTARWYVPAAILPLAAFFVTNWICTGGIKPFYAYYGTEKYVYLHEGVPSYWADPQGLDRNAESTWIYLFHCLLGHHGILSLTPVFLLTIAGWLKPTRHESSIALRPLQWMGAALSVTVLAFYLTRTQNYNYGGNSAALRWMLWLIPFWWYGMVPVVTRLTKSVKGMAVLVLLLSVSTFSSVYSIHQPWASGWIYRVMAQAGWIDYGTEVPPFDPPRYSVLASLPETVGLTGQWWCRVGETEASLTITSGDPVQTEREVLFPLQIELQRTGGLGRSFEVVILPGPFRAGHDIVEWLRILPELETELSDDSPSAPAQIVNSVELTNPPRWIVDVLRGMPASRAFVADSPRYLKYTRPDGEKTAIRCEFGASRVAFRHPQHGKCWQRCDVFYADELPYGVAAWRITVTSDTSQQVLRTEFWSCRNLP